MEYQILHLHKSRRAHFIRPSGFDFAVTYISIRHMRNPANNYNILQELYKDQTLTAGGCNYILSRI